MRRQHYIRIAGYCQLIEHCERAQSPYGLVLEQGSYVARVVKNTQTNQRLLREALYKAREVIHLAVTHGKEPSAPKSLGRCQECPIGFPRTHRAGKTELVIDGEEQQIRRLRGRDGRIYHSKCGDRFWWVPPSLRVTLKRLVRDPEDLR